MVKKYEATALLWSPSRNKYLRPGEIIELDDEIAKVLLDKKVIKPAVYRRKATKTSPAKLSGKKVVKEQDYGTND